MFIINVLTKRPNAKEKQLSLDMFFNAPTTNSGPTNKDLPIHPNDKK